MKKSKLAPNPPITGLTKRSPKFSIERGFEERVRVSDYINNKFKEYLEVDEFDFENYYIDRLIERYTYVPEDISILDQLYRIYKVNE